METTALPPDDRPPVERPRRVNRGLVWAAALAVVVLAVATVVAFVAGDGSDDQPVKLDPNGVAPEDGFSGEDVTGEALPSVTYETFEGTDVALTTAGKPMVVNFWASYCIPCVTEMPDLQRVYQEGGDSISFLGIQVADGPEKGRNMIATTGISYPVGRDPGGEIFQAFGGVSLPRTVIVAADGTITWAHTGPISAADLQQALAEHAGS